jgi:glycosyltransferase involved in cell wall biosynthesis
MYKKKTNNKTKVLLVIYGDIHFGGVSILLNNLISNMDSDGIEFTLYAFGGCTDKEVYDLYEKNGVKIITGLHTGFNSKQIFKDLFRIVSKGRFDIVHCNTGGLELTFITMTVAWLCGVKKRIAHSHAKKNSKAPYGKREILWQKGNYYLSNVRLTCSDEAGLHLFGNNRARLLCNGINVEKFTFNGDVRGKVRKQLGIEGRLVIGTVGRLEPIKNQVLILEIAKVLKLQAVDVCVLIVGSGSLKNKLVEYCSELSLNDSVIFIDATYRPDYYLNAMDVFLLPSLAEGLGISAVEAQAMDLPVWCSCNVPRQAAVTEKIFFEELPDGAYMWADNILNYCNEHNLEDRKDRSADVRNKGYDISESARQLRDIYLE